MKTANKILIVAFILIVCTVKAQISVQTVPEATINQENPFLDASKYNNFSPNVGKGLYFPRTDLTTWEFNTNTISGGLFSSYFDGMVVYNTTTGQTIADPSKGGIQVEVTPGFYYFNNPGAATIIPGSSVATGKWERILNTGDASYIIGGLKIVTENGKTGYRLRNENEDHHADIGDYAVDLSVVPVPVGAVPPATFNFGATGDYSFAAGFYSLASNMSSFAAGTGTISSGLHSTAFGHFTKATGTMSTAMGMSTIASGNRSVATGMSTTASGSSSVTMGIGTTASGAYSVAMGNGSKSTGDLSLTMGAGARATGRYATAIGRFTTASSACSVSIGKFNTLENEPEAESFSDYRKRLLVIGNGTGDGSTSDAFTVLRNGRVGIDIDNFEDTTNNAKLQVNGTIASTSTSISSYPDYVFETYYDGFSDLKTNYEFSSLEKVEAFVKANKHLPGYKSEKEIREEGFVNLTQTQMVNMEKIEELYLHTIEQNKKIKTQQKEIEELKTMVKKLLKQSYKTKE